jgi:NhaP-type Na+/H+ or K+/H+ antiporter
VHGVETVLFLVVLGTVVAAFAGRLRVPAPSLLVIAGLIVGLLPRFPPIHVPPDVVSLVVVVVVVVVLPLLYAARSMSQLATPGLVMVCGFCLM